MHKAMHGLSKSSLRVHYPTARRTTVLGGLYWPQMLEAAAVAAGIDRNFEPGFFVEHFIKDMGIALDEAKRMNLPLPGLALANQLYLAVQAQGYGRKGTHALMLALEHLSGIKR